MAGLFLTNCKMFAPSRVHTWMCLFASPCATIRIPLSDYSHSRLRLVAHCAVAFGALPFCYPFASAKVRQIPLIAKYHPSNSRRFEHQFAPFSRHELWRPARSSWSWSFWSKSFPHMPKPPLYIINILFIYSEPMTESEIHFDHFDLDHFDHNPWSVVMC